MDLISVERIKLLHPVVRAKALQGLELADKHIGKNRIRYTQTIRAFKEQADLFALGRSKAGKIVTNASAGRSYHNYGLAIDFCLIAPDGKNISWSRTEDLDKDGKADWGEFAAIMEGLGFEWGGRWKFKDYPHLELNRINGVRYTIGSLLERHNQKKVDENGFIIL